MSLAAYNCFSIPYFSSFNDDIENSLTFMVFDSLIDFFFIIDIVFNFRTTVIHPRTGEELTSVYMIAKHYISSGKFFIDLLAALPIDVFIMIIQNQQNEQVQWIQLAKLTRITRLSRIINYMRAQDDIKLSLKLFQLVFFLLLYIHFIACFWNIII